MKSSYSFGLKIDWLALTLNDTSDAWNLVLTLSAGRALSWVAGGGWHGYESSYRLDNGAVVAYGGVNGGVHLELPATALSFFGDAVPALLDVHDWKCSRLDVAADTDAVTVQEIVLGRQWRTKSKSIKAIQDLVSGDYETLYIGSRSRNSRKFVRVYDKAKEQGVDGVWTRVEVQLRDRFADAALRFIYAGGALEDVLLRSIDFFCGESRSAWYVALVGGGRTRFRFPAIVSSLQGAIEFVERIAPAIVKAEFVNGYGWLRGLLFRAAGRVDFEAVMRQIRETTPGWVPRGDLGLAHA